MNPTRLEQIRVHVDEGGKLTHQNAVELLTELEYAVGAVQSLMDDITRGGRPSSISLHSAARFGIAPAIPQERRR
jgi:hypothetical protein